MFQSPDDVLSTAHAEGLDAAQNRQEFLAQIAARIVERTGKRSADLDAVLNLLESSQSRRTSDRGGESLSFFDQITRLNPSVATIIRTAHDEMVQTLRLTQPEKFGGFFTSLLEPGSIAAGYEIRSAISAILRQR